jgi:L-methionine (R)-S-oxide reductase
MQSQRATVGVDSPGDIYAELQRSVAGLLSGEHDLIANTANFAALVYNSLPELNWAGCYFLRGDQLVLGPFQGRPACVRIAMGRGVCGTAAQRRMSMLVPDVHQFPDHIVCDPVSRSELVVPMLDDDRLIGVFDLDSPRPGRFEAADQVGIEAAVQLLMQACRQSG